MTLRLLNSPSTTPFTGRTIAALLTGILFGLLTWRVGANVDLLPYSYLAAVGVPLAIIDTVEQRLPSPLVLPSYLILGATFTLSATVHTTPGSLLRALVGMVLLAGFYLALAVISAGGLGAGDVKLGGLLGLALAWQSWTALLTGTLLGWLLAAVTWTALRFSPRWHRDSTIPLGPFLLAGAFAALLTQPQ
ncbi:prepilin peptidase [Longimycelium tulufanense]|uniref:prepilin peptidase n=1 Tax=Longimycelium tulufanense TaxID=907463 RepID=UPI001E53E3B4|nr:prepilin peptidase [Longimycelium tulufanense]